MHRTFRRAAGFLAAAVLILMPVSPVAHAAAPAPVLNCLHAVAANQEIPRTAGARPDLRPVGKATCSNLDT